MRIFAALLTLAILGCPTDWRDNQANAGCPKVFVHKQAVVLQAVPIIQYQVGTGIREEALIKAAVSQALAEFTAKVTTTQTTTTTQANISSSGHAATQVQSAGQFQRCAKCHTGPNRTGFRVDQELSCEDRLRAISMLLHDDVNRRMPKGTQLPADELGLLIQAFSAGIVPRAQVTTVPPEPRPPAPGTQP